MFAELVVRQRLQDDAYDRDVRVAYMTASLMKRDKLPKIETLYAKRERQTQNAKQQRGQVELLSQQYGIPLRPALKVKVIRRG